MDFKNRLYEIFYPTEALIGSQCNPDQLARHYTIGSTRHYRGKAIFAEIDYEFRDPYFDIDGAIRDLLPHEDGRPKHTKYISSYRVLEHVALEALGDLYLTSPDGRCQVLHAAPVVPEPQEKGLKIYVEIAPLGMLVLSKYDFADFGRFITDAANPVGAPKFIYSQLDLDIVEFLEEFEDNPFMLPPIPSLHPSILRDAITELVTNRYKDNKGLSLRGNFESIPYKLIKNGFMLASQEKMKFYPMPPLAEIEKTNYKFWRSM